MPALFGSENPYPLLMFHATLEPTNALDEKQAAELRRKGYQDQYIPKEYPQHVPTGGTRRIPNNDGDYTINPVTGVPGCGTYTEIPETVIVHSKAEHMELLEKLKGDPSAADGEPVKRGPGRPRKEETTAA